MNSSTINRWQKVGIAGLLSFGSAFSAQAVENIPASAPVLSAPQVHVPAKNSFVDTSGYVAPPAPAPRVVIESRSPRPAIATVTPKRPIRQAVPKPIATRSNRTRRQAARQTASRRWLKSGSRVQQVAVTQPIPPTYNRATAQPYKDRPSRTSLIFPVSVPSVFSSAFGWRTHPISGRYSMHYGTDIAAPMGTPVLAVYPGEVAIADYLGGYGLTIILRHEEQTQESRYAHLSETFVEPGDVVEQGSVIGLVGNTGNSTGPHLHFEWRHATAAGWTAVDAGGHLELALDNLLRNLTQAENMNASNQDT